MDTIKFFKFDSGIIEKAEGVLVEVNNSHVVVLYNNNRVNFSRTPGKRAGYGVGKAKCWRLNEEERSKYVHKEMGKLVKK